MFFGCLSRYSLLAEQGSRPCCSSPIVQYNGEDVLYFANARAYRQVTWPVQRENYHGNIKQAIWLITCQFCFVFYVWLDTRLKEKKHLIRIDRNDLLFQKIVKEMMLGQFLSVLLQVLIVKSHDLLSEEIAIVVYNMASVDFDGFYSNYLPQLLANCEGIDDNQKAVLAQNFKVDTVSLKASRVMPSRILLCVSGLILYYVYNI